MTAVGWIAVGLALGFALGIWTCLAAAIVHSRSKRGEIDTTRRRSEA